MIKIKRLNLRAWIKDEKVFLKVFQIHLNCYGEIEEIGVKYGDEIGNRLTFLPKGNFELLQYTGLKDIKAQAICEGDILKLGHYNFEEKGFYAVEGEYEVKYNEDSAAFCLDESPLYYLLYELAYDVEVVSNKYEK